MRDGRQVRAVTSSSCLCLPKLSSLISTEKRNYPRLFKFLRPSLFPVKCDQVCSNNCLEHTITIKALIAHFHSNRMVHFVLQFKLRQDLAFCMKDAPIMRDVIWVDIWWYWNWILVILKYSEIWSGLGKCHGCQDPDSLDGIRIFMRPSWINCVQLCCVGPWRYMTSSILFTYQPHSEKISLGKLKFKAIFDLRSLKVFVSPEPLSLLPSPLAAV